MYAVGVLLTEGGSDVGVRINLASDGCIGMLPVFATKEDALEAFPSFQLIRIEATQQQKETE